MVIWYNKYYLVSSRKYTHYLTNATVRLATLRRLLKHLYVTYTKAFQNYDFYCGNQENIAENCKLLGLNIFMLLTPWVSGSGKDRNGVYTCGRRVCTIKVNTMSDVSASFISLYNKYNIIKQFSQRTKLLNTLTHRHFDLGGFIASTTAGVGSRWVFCISLFFFFKFIFI